MIRNLSGVVIEKGDSHVVLDVSGVGYFVRLPQLTCALISEGNELFLWTHLAVKETAMELYGFSSREDLSFFELLLTVPGIGPKSALSILNLAPVSQLISAIASGDSVYLTKISGIGKRSSAKIVLELKEKLEGASSEGETKEFSDTLLALQTLGYSPLEAREAVRSIENPDLNTNEKIKEALKYLARS